MDAVLEWIWKEVNERIDALRSDVTTFIARAERSEVTGSAEEIAFADLPTIADSPMNGNLYWVTDGRKMGEGAGAGTGVLVYYNEATTTWKRIADDSDVAI